MLPFFSEDVIVSLPCSLLQAQLEVLNYNVQMFKQDRLEVAPAGCWQFFKPKD